MAVPFRIDRCARITLDGRYSFSLWRMWFGAIGDCMDLIEAKKNLESLHQDKEKLQSLNHLNSTFQFKQACRQRINDIDKQINNIQHSIKRYARP